MKRAVFEKDFIRVEDSETGTPGAFLKFAFRVQACLLYTSDAADE